MKVIAIRDSYFNDDTKPTDKAIHKGSIYHVIDKHFKPGDIYFLDTETHYPNGVYCYELLEQKGMHVVDLFLELPDNLFETEKTKQDEYIYN